MGKQEQRARTNPFASHPQASLGVHAVKSRARRRGEATGEGSSHNQISHNKTRQKHAHATNSRLVEPLEFTENSQARTHMYMRRSCRHTMAQTKRRFVKLAAVLKFSGLARLAGKARRTLTQGEWKVFILQRLGYSKAEAVAWRIVRARLGRAWLKEFVLCVAFLSPLPPVQFDRCY